MIAQSARMMRCYVLIDLKRDKLTHQYLGQMQIYIVNAEWGTHCPPHGSGLMVIRFCYSFTSVIPICCKHYREENS